MHEISTEHVQSLSYPPVFYFQAYQGALQHIRDPIQRQKVIGDVVDRARSFVSALEASGVKCSLVTGGGSGSYKIEARSGVYTEVQPGEQILHCSVVAYMEY